MIHSDSIWDSFPEAKVLPRWSDFSDSEQCLKWRNAFSPAIFEQKQNQPPTPKQKSVELKI